MYDDENEDIGFDNEFCENCPMYRQRPPIFSPSGPQEGPPSGPPPSFTPQLKAQQGMGAFAIDPGSIRRCRNRFVYLQLRNGREFWAWLTFVGRRSVAGWRWTGFRWVYFGVDLRQIVSFSCF